MSQSSPCPCSCFEFSWDITNTIITREEGQFIEELAVEENFQKHEVFFQELLEIRKTNHHANITYQV